MRILLTSHHASDHESERGATVVIVAFLAAILLVISAFTIDLGKAYVSKRNLQKAADAGALAAAQEFTQFRGSCEEVLANPTARANAVAAAERMRAANREAGFEDSRPLAPPAFACVDGTLRVTYAVEGDTTSFFSGLTGTSDEITTNREAIASMEVSQGGIGMRPLALCSGSLADGNIERVVNAEGSWIQVHFPGAGRVPPDACDVDLPGNWWLTDCPEERTGSANTLVTQIQSGCTSPVSVVSGQGETTSPEQLTILLEGSCPDAADGSETCLSGNTGNIAQGQTPGAWQELIRSEEIALFPVFCAPPHCSSGTADGTGTNTVFPVYKLLAAVTCGYHFDRRNRYGSNSGACSGNPFNPMSDNSGNNYFVFKEINMRTSTSNAEAECELGAECDGGLRKTRLVG